MTPQSSFMVLAPIDSGARGGAAPAARVDERRARAGQPDNALVPFAQFDTLHVARLLILDDKTLGRRTRLRPAPPHLSALSRVSRRRRRRRGRVPRRAGEARAGRACARSSPVAKGSPPDADLAGVDEAHTAFRPRPTTSTGGAGRCARFAKRRRCTTRSQRHLRADAAALDGSSRRGRFTRRLRQLRPGGDVGRAPDAVPGGADAARLVGSAICCTCIGMPLLLLLLASPLLVLVAPSSSSALAPLEKTDPELCSARGPGLLRRAGAAGGSRRHQPVQRHGKPEAGHRAAAGR